jgi:hypothetical protein
MSVPDSKVQDFIMWIPNLAYDDTTWKEKEKQRIVDWLDRVWLGWPPIREERVYDDKAWKNHIMF